MGAGYPPQYQLIFQNENCCEYALAQGGFKSKSYLEVMDWVAQKASQTLAQTGHLTVIVQDNGSLHKSRLVQQQWSRWQEQG